MTSMSDYAPLFATPYTGPATRMIQTIARARAESTKKRIVRELQSDSPHSANQLGSFESGDFHVWRPEIGLAHNMVVVNQMRLAAIQCAVAYYVTGGCGELSILLKDPGWILVSGWTIRVEGQCTVSAYENKIRITSKECDAEFSLSGGRADLVGGTDSSWQAYNDIVELPFYLTDAGIVIDKEEFPWVTDYPDAAARQRNVPTVEEDKKKIIAGWRMLTDHAPVYKEWVASTMHGGLLVENSNPEINTSGSSSFFPGLVYLQAASAIKVAECLVHECSHQHFYAFSLVSPLIAEQSNEEFYSPIKKTERSLYNILLAAHAVANMIKYYDELSVHVRLSEEETGKHKMMREWFRSDYCSALNSANSLTDSGHKFWHSVRNSVI